MGDSREAYTCGTAGDIKYRGYYINGLNGVDIKGYFLGSLFISRENCESPDTKVKIVSTSAESTLSGIDLYR